ncbi:MAG: hypothetical protein ACJ76Y_10135 [Thermoanaerobaculia bacterium]
MSLSISRTMLAAASLLLVSAACEKGGGVAVEIPKDATATEFVYKNGDLGAADNSPMIGEKFAFDTKTDRAQLASSSNFTSFSFAATADFRNTIFNFKKVPRDHRVITFASVNMNNGIEYYIALHAEHDPIVYFTKNHLVIPTDLRRLSRDGPFAKLKFQCTKDGTAIKGCSIKIYGPSGLIGQGDSIGDGRLKFLLIT